MSNSATHALTGAVVGVGIYYLAKKYLFNEEPVLGEAVAAGVAGAGIALLPDIIEPATNPRHRAFFHSVASASMMSYTTNNVMKNPQIEPQVKLGVALFAGCYGSHLLLDSATPASLPLI